MLDSFGRNIDYLRVSLTDRCNLRCIYCMPEVGVANISHDDILRIEEIISIIEVAARLGFKHIRLTGGEPLVRRGVIDAIRSIKNIPSIENVSLTTNATLLSRYAGELKAAGLDRVNISLDTLDASQYRAITRCGNLDDALLGIDTALKVGFSPIKINAVAVRSLKQDYAAFARMSINQPLHMRFIEYMPIGQSTGTSGCGWGVDDVISCDEILECINHDAKRMGLGELTLASEQQCPIGFGPARYYTFPHALGTVGFISPLSKHFCSSCNRMRLTADGKLRPCLFSDTEFDMRKAVREGGAHEIAEVFYQAVGNKPDEHHNKQGTVRKMSQIGG